MAILGGSSYNVEIDDCRLANSYDSLPSFIIWGKQGPQSKNENFFLARSSDQHKYPLVKWKKVCERKEVDGVGLKDLHLQK